MHDDGGAKRERPAGVEPRGLEPGAGAPPGATSGATSGAREQRRWANRVFRWVWAIGLLLMVIDVTALTILLYGLGFDMLPAFGLAFLTGGFGTYEAQFKNLLSRQAFLVHRSPGRHLAMAAFCLLANIGSLWLVGLGATAASGARGMYLGAYALARVAMAAVVVWAWGSRLGPRLLGDRP